MPVEFPEPARVLFNTDARYIALWGGRGSAKSWSIARALLIRAAGTPLRVLCGRELQNSIAESVHKLLSDQVDDLGLSDFYTIQQKTITGRNGSEFIFAGIKNNIDKIKSYEGVDIVWLEEAQAVTQTSWNTLTPTIRKAGSQIILSFNPVLEADFIYQRFVVKPPDSAIVVKMNYNQNPWFGEPLLSEMKQMRREDPDGFSHVYGGNCRHALEGAIFANEIRDAEFNNRITSVPWVEEVPVDLFLDLGHRDATAIFFAQIVGMEFRIVDFYENSGHKLGHYIKVLQEKPYTYGTTWLPHDAEHDLLGSERTITQQMRAAGHKVMITPNVSKVSQIEAGRAVFSRCYFDRERTADGLQHLRHYQYEIDPKTNLRAKTPKHDEHSHAADAFLYLGVSLRPSKNHNIPAYVPPRRIPTHQSGSWLGNLR